MPTPRAREFKPNCQFGVASTFMIHGKHFGAVGSLVTVKLVSDDGYTWTPASIPNLPVLAGECVRVTSTPSDTHHKGAGLGDLTITVTNATGVVSNPQSAEVFYTP